MSEKNPHSYRTIADRKHMNIEHTSETEVGLFFSLQYVHTSDEIINRVIAR
jgi:hypothetical protein